MPRWLLKHSETRILYISIDKTHFNYKIVKNGSSFVNLFLEGGGGDPWIRHCFILSFSLQIIIVYSRIINFLY